MMQPPTELLLSDLEFSFWANAALLRALGPIDSRELEAAPPVSRSDIYKILVHIFVGERVWLEFCARLSRCAVGVFRPTHPPICRFGRLNLNGRSYMRNTDLGLTIFRRRIHWQRRFTSSFRTGEYRCSPAGKYSDTYWITPTSTADRLLQP